MTNSNANNVAQKIEFNAKEYQDELSLNWYDYGARNYDPTVGSWFNVDPLAEKYRRWTPYNYCMNNPVYFVDPDGMSSKSNESNNYDYLGRSRYDRFGSYIPMADRGADALTTENLQDFLAFVNMGRQGGHGEPGTGRSWFRSTWSSIKGFFGLGNRKTISISVDEPELVEFNEQPVDYSNTIASVGLITAGVLLADDPTVFGVADDIFIPPVLLATAAGVLVAKATYEITKIMQRELGKKGFQYALIANVSGEYPVYIRGQRDPVTTKHLQAGEVWKYGETTSSDRYDDPYLESIEPGGVTMVEQFYGNQVNIKIAEKAKLYNYYLIHGELPPGNKIFR